MYFAINDITIYYSKKFYTMDSYEMNDSLTEVPEGITPETLVSSIPAEEEVPVLDQKQKMEKVIERLKEISNDPCSAEKSELTQLKQSFYKAHKANQEALYKEHIDAGGSADSFVMPDNDYENQFKEIMSSIKEKRYEIQVEEDKDKEENLNKKLEIIEKMKELTESPEDANKLYNEFKKLQQEWNEIKAIPQSRANELWKSYQIYAEKFYDIIKLNNEFREYDFKKNLEIKLHLCEAAEKLAQEQDVVSAFHQLQKLHHEFRETGPVSKELREEVWNRFKAASTVVNRKHQQHFEELKEKEQRNLDEKTVICEIVESMDFENIKTFQEWDDKTQEVLALQAKWKTIGYAPQKMNIKIFERFRTACDLFFSKKGEFFKNLKDNMASNLEKKKELCEKAEALKDSTEWKETAEILSNLQKQWKEIGPVPKKYSDSIWKRFISACDYFFEQKNKNSSSKFSIEHKNLELKKEIIEKLNEINSKENSEEGDEESIKELMSSWNNIGHVPFKEKDKIYNQYHDIVNKLFKKLNISTSQKKLNNFKTSINGKGANLYREREKLVRQYENMKNDLATYENNLGFLTTTSKKGSSLVTEMNYKVDKIKTDLELLLEKISIIDNLIQQENN